MNTSPAVRIAAALFSLTMTLAVVEGNALYGHPPMAGNRSSVAQSAAQTAIKSAMKARPSVTPPVAGRALLVVTSTEK